MKKKEFFAGLLCGALVFGGGTAFAANVLTATPSQQGIYVDGQRADLEAYTIQGHNYVQLRDIGRAVGFAVDYDSATNSVQVDTSKPYTEEVKPSATPAPVTATDGVITIPQSDEKLNLKVGDKIQCDDGTVYEITDMSRYELHSLPEMPTPTCDWSQFPELKLPQVEVLRSNDEYGDDLFIMNLREMRRMQYTLYNLIGSNPDTWRDDAPKLNYAKTGPLVNVYFTLDGRMEPQVFWPWRESNISNLFNSRPVSQYHVRAWDHYINGKFQETRYEIQSV